MRIGNPSDGGKFRVQSSELKERSPGVAIPRHLVLRVFVPPCLTALVFELRRIAVVLVASLLLALAGCAAPVPGGDVGVGTGGAQDIAYARSIIDAGGIPDPSTITVEGFLSEHSIDLEPPADAGELYATATASWNADFDELTPLVTVQVGFGSTVDLASFHRQPINLALVLDRSGSMLDDFDVRTRTSKLDAVRIAIDQLLASLSAQDRVSVVSFAEQPTTLLEPVPGNDIVSIKSALEGLTARGATDLAAGMLRGYQLVQSDHAAGRADRVMVFTDANVTAGISRAEDFLAVMESYAADDIGATLVGVGVDFGQQLAYDISQVRGGNFVYLNDYDRILQVFGDEFDFLVSPIARDVHLAADLPFAFDVADAFGLPGADVSTHKLEMVIPTLFYSARQGGGAIMIRLRPGASVDFSHAFEPAVISLDYETVAGESVADRLHLTLPASLDRTGARPFFPNLAARRGVLLLNTALVLQNAALDVYSGYVSDGAGGSYHYPSFQDYNRAAARLTEFLPYFDTLAAGLDDQPSDTSRSLSQERAVLVKLLENIQARGGGSTLPASF